MNILIVDDDAYIIRVIKQQINWGNIGIDKVFTALNTSRGKEIMLEEQIDVLLTDIEMPKESGLQFMEWIINQGLTPEAICLTCHAEFHYAREALKLGFSEYCIKPIEFKVLEEILRKAVSKHSKTLKKANMESEGARWIDNKKIVASDFWYNLLLGKYHGQLNHILRLAKQKEVDYIFDQTYRVVLFGICSKAEATMIWVEDQNLMKYSLTNIISEKFSLEETNGMIGWHENRIWLVLQEMDEQTLEEIEDYIKVCKDLLGIKIAAYIGEGRFGEELHDEFKTLLDLDIDNVHREANLFFTNEALKSTQTAWLNARFMVNSKNALMAGDYGTFFNIIDELFQGDIGWNRESLEGLLLNILQLVFVKLDNMNMVAEQFFDPPLRSSYKNSHHSLEDTKEYIELLKKRFALLTEQKNKDSMVITEVKNYIREHIDTKLQRKEIADSVFLSADYVTKLFKKETGITLIEFITDEKINVAKEMMKEENIMIGEVAQRLSYDNFSYFSEMFRKKTGMSPSDYKKYLLEKPELDY